ncbi:hypothetical protein YPPY53_3137, partial [Yersinia pestis PY-53]
MTLVFIK